MRANMRAGGVIDAVVTSSLLESVRIPIWESGILEIYCWFAWSSENHNKVALNLYMKSEKVNFSRSKVVIL